MAVGYHLRIDVTRYYSRRRAIQAGLLAATVGVAGCMGDDADDTTPQNDDTGDDTDDANGTTDQDDDAGDDDPPEETGIAAIAGDPWVDHPYPEAETDSFTLGRTMPGIDFEPLVDIGGHHVPEGLAYRDGYIYTGERDSPCTIREYTIDGEKTDREYTFHDRPGVDHTNTMDWFDGNLWVSDSSTSRTYILDWGDEPEIVDEFAQEDPYSGTWRMIIPTSDDVPKIVANQWRGPDAWIFDLESVLEDGTWEGNVDRTIRNGFFTDPQTMYWHEGDLYTTTHDWVIKSSLPYADEIEAGQPLIQPDTIEYAWELEVGSRLLEQLVYNPDDDEYYLCDRGDGAMLFRGVERDQGHTHRPWSAWPTATVGEDDTAVINADRENRDVGLLRMTTGYGADKTGWVDTWVYDTGTDDQHIEISYLSTDDEQMAFEIRSDRDWGEDHYTFIHRAESEIIDTGIERVDEAWIKFGWEVMENAVTAYVWTAEEGWQEAATIEGDYTGSQVAIRRTDGETLIGDWTVALER